MAARQHNINHSNMEIGARSRGGIAALTRRYNRGLSGASDVIETNSVTTLAGALIRYGRSLLQISSYMYPGWKPGSRRDNGHGQAVAVR